MIKLPESKETKPTLYYRSADVEFLIQPYIDSKIDFEVRKTGYSCTIISSFEKILISNNRSSRRVFAASAKLGAELDKAPEIDFIPHNQIKYFDFSETYASGTTSFRRAYCVDIKSAYLSCLHVNKVISDEVFKALNRLKKLDRLKTVGMMATNTVIFKYRAGKLFDFDTKCDKHRRKYFMMVCYEIGMLMDTIQKATGDDFMFFWVDGMYFKSIKAANIAKEILSSNGYKYSFDILENLWITNMNRHAYINFQKDSEKKSFRISKKSSTFDTDASIKRMIKEAEKTIIKNQTKAA